MMRPAPASPASMPSETPQPGGVSPASQTEPGASSARPSSNASNGVPSLMLRRTDTDASASEPAESLASSRAIGEPRPAPAPLDGVAPDRRAANLFTPTAPTSPSAGSRRKQSPNEFRERCGADGGSMQGGGKYGLCIIR